MKVLYVLSLILMATLFIGCDDASDREGIDPSKESPFQLIINNISQHTIDEVIIHTSLSNYSSKDAGKAETIINGPFEHDQKITFDLCEHTNYTKQYITVVRKNASTDQKKIAITTNRSFSFAGDAGTLQIDIYGTDFVYNYSKNNFLRVCK